MLPSTPDSTVSPSHGRASHGRASHGRGEKLDQAGATASLLCAIHCAAMPLLLTTLPLWGLSFLASEPVEWALWLSSATLGTCSLCLGFRQHRRRRVFGLLTLALGLLGAGRWCEAHELGAWSAVVMVAGGLLMAAAHLFNRHLCRSCRVCRENDGCHSSH